MNAPMILPDIRPITVRACCQAVEVHYGCTREELLSPSREAEIVRPRQVAMYLAERHTSANMNEIGRFFGGRHHSTVRHSIRLIQAEIAADRAMANDVADIEGMLQAVRRSSLRLPAEYPDPLRVALALMEGQRVNPTTEELRGLVAYAIQRAIAAGELAFEGDEPAGVDAGDDLAPTPSGRPTMPTELRAALREVLAARAAHKAADALARANTRVRLEIALDGLQLAFEAVSKEI